MDDAVVLNFRVTQLESAVEKVSVAVVSIDKSLQLLTQLDVKHDEMRSALNRAFDEMRALNDRAATLEKHAQSALSYRNDCETTQRDHEIRLRQAEKDAPKNNDTRLASIEREMPTLILARGWVIALVIGAFVTIAYALIGLVVSK